jgi:hypothetical protein
VIEILRAGALAVAWNCALAAEKEATMKLTSPSFAEGQPIPAKFSCTGQDVSPALKWEGAPAETKSFALVCDDPDAMSVAGKVWVHWVAWGIPANRVELPENASKADTALKQGMTDFGRVGYGGPCPPPRHGVHHYHFRLYALDTALIVPAKATRKLLEEAMKGRVLAQAELIGTFERK